MHLARAAQLAAKAELLREALRRIGHFESLPNGLTVTAAGSDLRYRSRVRLHVDRSGRVGLFAPRSHRLVDVDDCLVGPEVTGEVIRLLRDVGSRESSALRRVETVELRVAPQGPKVVLRIHLRRPRRAPGVHPPLPREVAAWLDRLSLSIPLSVVGEDRWEHAEQRFDLPGGIPLVALPGGFTQINWAVNCELVGSVVNGARQRNVSRFCDLYAGAGNFSLALLATGMSGLAVEVTSAGVKSAAIAAQAAGLPPDTFRQGDALEQCERLRRAREVFDLVVLDPPRRGAREVATSVARLAPRHVVFCACDPATLARDLMTLTGHGYQLEQLQGFDMFPHTHHLEAIAWLRRLPRQ